MVTLCILDGFGINENEQGNAIKLQGTPNLNKLNEYPTTTLQASGLAVGLTEGQMGNSEVGHLNLGAGRVIYQDLPKINNEIANGNFFKNPAFLEVMNHVLNNNSNLHLMGLLSDAGVHAHINHLKALVEMANVLGIKNIYIHALTDGRDTLPNKGVLYVKEIESAVGNKAKIASISGRVYAMDRENRWDRIKQYYDVIVNGVAKYESESAVGAVNQSYEKGVFDEFIEPTIVLKDVTLNDGDGFIFYNYRTDRAREITNAITQKDFKEFETKKLKNFKYCCMTEYSKDFKDVLIAYPPENVEDNLSAIISNYGLKQFHTSETTKYAHVTFFFNGGIEKAYKGEDRKLIDSVDVKNFSEVPNMRSYEITEEVVNAIQSKKYDFILVNLSNPDMIGHTGDLNAAIEAIKAVDECAYKIAEETLKIGGDCIITADHGNCEEMVDKDGNVLTQHTTNPVPLWLVSDKYKDVKLKTGKLANVAPTVLKLLNKQIPSNMEDPLF